MVKDGKLRALAVSSMVLTVHPSLPAQTVQDLVTLIKASPGKYSFASPGTGTPTHLVGELFRLSLSRPSTSCTSRSTRGRLAALGYEPVASTARFRVEMAK